MKAVKNVAIVIPSLSPDEKLLALLKELREAEFENIVVVNDGSAPQYDPYFTSAKEEYGCTVLTHAVNQGKGRALKTAFNHLLTACPDCAGAVTVDSDGQHRVPDILRVAKETVENPESLIMGCRDFKSKDPNIPFRSRYGNRITSRVLHMLCGISLSDTQTGLRGFSPLTMRRFMSTKGERFEYEMNMILDAKEAGVSLREIPIETVYIEENRTSHFNPLKDSLRIYAVFSKFILASLSSFFVDILLYALFIWAFTSFWAPQLVKENVIVIAAYAARAISSLFNYFVNRKGVFKSHANKRSSIVRYAVLCVAQITISAFATSWLYSLLGWSSTIIKLVVDTVLFLFSFRIQRSWVFRKK